MGLLEGASTGTDTSDDDLEEEEQKDVSTGVMTTQEDKSIQQQRQSLKDAKRNEMAIRGAPWFEDLVENSKLGTLRRRKGGHTSKDGSVSVEWEVAEWESSGDGGFGVEDLAGDVQGTGKRKLGDVVADSDLSMRNV